MSTHWHNSAVNAGRGHVPGPVVMGTHSPTDGNGHALHAPVLVLNASYEPINVCAARRAIVLVLKGVASARARESRRRCETVALVGYTVGGRPGARLLRHLGMASSTDTVLRRIKARARNRTL